MQNEWLLEQLKLSKKKLFGRSSEQAEQLVNGSGAAPSVRRFRLAVDKSIGQTYNTIKRKYYSFIFISFLGGAAQRALYSRLPRT